MVSTIKRFMKRAVYERIMERQKLKARRENARGHFHFEDRKKNRENLLYILAGYKPDLWSEVFRRILKEDLSDFDVCILSSGLYDRELDRMADRNGWSYVWSQENVVSNIQNYAISVFPEAKTIWKMDEDMFLCRDYFNIMRETRKKAESESDYEIGFAGPLIPINSYGYIRFLRIIGRFDEYEQRFGIAKVGGYADKRSNNLWTFEANDFLWKATGNLDSRAGQLNTGKREYSLCYGKYSIGAIMFERRVWEEMGGFERDKFLYDGRDELSILAYCSLKSRVIVVAEDALVGHYGFGGIYRGVQDKKKWLREYILDKSLS